MGVFRKKLESMGSANLSDKSNNGGYNRVFKPNLSLPFYKIVQGANGFNILPYEVTSKHNNLVYTGKVKVGDGAYVLPIYVHKGIGDNNATVPCPRETWGGKCPICEARREAFNRYNETKADEDKVYATSLRPRLRCIYNVAIVGGEHDGEVMLFDISDFKFHSPLLEYASEEVNDEDDPRYNMKRIGGVIDFPDVDEGYTVKFSGKNQSFNGYEFLEPANIRLSKRKEPVSEEQLAKVVSIDEFVNEMSYDEIAEIFENSEGGKDDDADDEKPAPKPVAKETSKETDKDEDMRVPWGDATEDKDACPFKHTFGADYDSTNECDKCMDENIACYKKCRKANADM